MKSLLLSLSIASFLGLAGFLPQSPVSAQTEELCGGANLTLASDSCNKPCTERNSNGTCKTRGDVDSEGKLNSLVQTIVNILSIIVGIVAVVMIIIGGLNFITSSGDAGKISSAKTTVIYAIVGLIIVALSQIIVRFVLTRV